MRCWIFAVFSSELKWTNNILHIFCPNCNWNRQVYIYIYLTIIQSSGKYACQSFITSLQIFYWWNITFKGQFLFISTNNQRGEPFLIYGLLRRNIFKTESFTRLYTWSLCGRRRCRPRQLNICTLRGRGSCRPRSLHSYTSAACVGEAAAGRDLNTAAHLQLAWAGSCRLRSLHSYTSAAYVGYSAAGRNIHTAVHLQLTWARQLQAEIVTQLYTSSLRGWGSCRPRSLHSCTPAAYVGEAATGRNPASFSPLQAFEMPTQQLKCQGDLWTG